MGINTNDEEEYSTSQHAREKHAEGMLKTEHMLGTKDVQWPEVLVLVSTIMKYSYSTLLRIRCMRNCQGKTRLDISDSAAS